MQAQGRAASPRAPAGAAAAVMTVAADGKMFSPDVFVTFSFASSGSRCVFLTFEGKAPSASTEATGKDELLEARPIAIPQRAGHETVVNHSDSGLYRKWTG
ncbi:MULTISPECIES: hypothetical protein [Mycobacterium avium complex (MAC)]|uniref:Uncharacterized protein n=2 Tax=Mycobacterium avium TaxID=1764 RepID=A0AAI8X4H3_MYCAV|nr:MULTISPECIES: hypothetical protein [Mycobacterium avium complex (MAC)]ETZ47833.1 hypothetical protein L839_1938 [Mycobacterium avium MAV_120809_2495]ETZ57610.1 hypothetical protein L840_2995 [Mycobacterium sp. MAC_011194_8550]ETZ64524.1 hypothetical protein L841_3956 [Mycobacterium sp. MAC_080597_8934]MBZ4576109.1 hypothetical protein [Mycobacterium avium subsp. hominissuis]MCA2239172.1 hypothetical protein [Mycobacterium avium]